MGSDVLRGIGPTRRCCDDQRNRQSGLLRQATRSGPSAIGERRVDRLRPFRGRCCRTIDRSRSPRERSSIQRPGQSAVHRCGSGRFEYLDCPGVVRRGQLDRRHRLTTPWHRRIAVVAVRGNDGANQPATAREIDHRPSTLGRVRPAVTPGGRRDPAASESRGDTPSENFSWPVPARPAKS